MAVVPITARTEFAAALNQICSERGIDPKIVLETMKVAILAAYRKDYGKSEEDLAVKLDPVTGEVAVFKGKKDVTPPGFGRIATQTAKQVILQGIREAEKTAILADFEGRVGTIVNGMVLRHDGQNIVVDLGRTEGLMPPSEQARGEAYRLNQRFKFYVVEIRESFKGRQIIVSRAHKGLVKGLFAQEVPEVASGVVEIRAIAREAGSRVKVAVHSAQPGIDPVGSCVGRQGVRVQAVISELGGQEKIDIVQFSSDPAKFIASALSPATNLTVIINEKKKTAQVVVPDDQLSLAIGREGQNVRLAAKLTGFKLDIKGASEVGKKPKKTKVAEEGLVKLGLSSRVLKALVAAKVKTVAKLRKLSDEEILAIPGLGEKALEEIRSKLT
jgi:N utilization substance protein A